MKISYKWLCEFLPVPIGPEALAEHLFLLGFEVSETRAVGPEFSGVVVAEILEIEKHPNADRLSLCSLTNGTDKFRVVCGAKNIAVGQRVPLALVGAKLPGGKVITRSKIRGTESEGMICSAAELGIAEANGDGIHVLSPDTPLGKDASSLLGEGDRVLEVEVTPNRPDCLSHYGLARELAIYFMSPLPPPSAAPTPAGPPGALGASIEAKGACGRYLGRSFTEVRVGPSAAWLARRLELAGLRPINNVVDITNYVLLEYGHPLHAFDADKLVGEKLRVRMARPGESIAALDGKNYSLSSEDLVIADASRPVAIAGIMGGAETGVTERTRSVFLEAAHFAPALVRRSSQRLRLRSDSSYRFERGTSPEMAALASARAAALIRELCGRPREFAPVDVYPEPSEPAPIEVSPQAINRILGTEHSSQKIERLLRSIAAHWTGGPQSFSFTPPTHRLDLRTRWDLAEEVGRHLGYDSIGSEAAPVRLQRPKKDPCVEWTRRLRERLAALGFLEAYNYDFISDKELSISGLEPGSTVDVLNPLSADWAHLRPSLLPGLLKSASYNFRRDAAGLRLFEVGRVYSPGKKDVHERAALAAILAGRLPARADWTQRQPSSSNHFFEAKGALLSLLEGVPLSWRQAPGEALFHPKATLSAFGPHGPLAVAGLLHPDVAARWDLPDGSAAFVVQLDALAAQPVPSPKFKPFSAFPTVTRDLSILVPEELPYGSVEGCLRGLPFLLDLQLVERIHGAKAKVLGLPAGKAGLTLRLSLGTIERTLRDEQVQGSVAEALERLGRECQAELRG